MRTNFFSPSSPASRISSTATTYFYELFSTSRIFPSRKFANKRDHRLDLFGISLNWISSGIQPLIL